MKAKSTLWGVMIESDVGREKPLSNHVISKNAKHIGRSILICGCMSWEGIGELTKIKGERVASIIKTSYMTTWFARELQYDPKHIRMSTIKWFNNHTIIVFHGAYNPPTWISSNTFGITTRNRNPNQHKINSFLLVSTDLGKQSWNKAIVPLKSTEWTSICWFQ